jgi:hypothetical protein
MTERRPDTLSEEEAAKVWERAARLQAESASQVEADPEALESPTSGYALTHVRSSAMEAGIASEFVDAALLDLRTEQNTTGKKTGSKLARRYLAEPPNTLTARRVIEASPADVLSAMQEIFPREPFRMTSTDQQGNPLEGGVLVFAIGGLNSPFPQGFALESRWGGFDEVFVSLRSIEGSRPHCEITVRSPVISHNIGLFQGLLLSVVSAGAGTGLGALGGVALGAMGVASGALPFVAAGGALVGALGGTKGYRSIYYYCMRRGTKALEGLVGAVAVRAQGVWQGASPEEGRRPSLF